jgi:hypothetical protein
LNRAKHILGNKNLPSTYTVHHVKIHQPNPPFIRKKTGQKKTSQSYLLDRSAWQLAHTRLPATGTKETVAPFFYCLTLRVQAVGSELTHQLTPHAYTPYTRTPLVHKLDLRLISRARIHTLYTHTTSAYLGHAYTPYTRTPLVHKLDL